VARSIRDDDLSDVSYRLRTVPRHIRRLHVRLHTRSLSVAAIYLVAIETQQHLVSVSVSAIVT